VSVKEGDMSKKILIVDDEPDVLDTVSARLERDGYDVVVANRGRDGLIRARAHLPDIVLMDIVLPDMDGAEAVKELHDHPATVGIPVVFLSGIIANEADGKSTEITVGGRSYDALGKPFTYLQLRDKIEKILALTE